MCFGCLGMWCKWVLPAIVVYVWDVERQWQLSLTRTPAYVSIWEAVELGQLGIYVNCSKSKVTLLFWKNIYFVFLKVTPLRNGTFAATLLRSVKHFLVWVQLGCKTPFFHGFFSEFRKLEKGAGDLYWRSTLVNTVPVACGMFMMVCLTKNL